MHAKNRTCWNSTKKSFRPLNFMESILNYPDDDSSRDKLIRRHRSHHRKGLDPSDVENLEVVPVLVSVEKTDSAHWLGHKGLHNVALALQASLLLSNCIFNIYCAAVRPEVTFLMIFHGVVSPVCVILFCCGVMSIGSGIMAVNPPKAFDSSVDRSAQWYRRYMRSSMYVVLLWILSTLTTVFGCWMYSYGTQLGTLYPKAELYASNEYSLVMKQILIGVSSLGSELEIREGITSRMQPLLLVKSIGDHYYIALVVYVLFPALLIWLSISFQRKYYAFRFANN